MSAFSEALIEQLHTPESELFYKITDQHRNSTLCACRDYLHASTEDKIAIDQCISDLKNAKILDVGAGLARHSMYCRTVCPSAEITIIERDLELCAEINRLLDVHLTTQAFRDIRSTQRYDLIMFLGLGLGMFCTEKGVIGALKRLRGMIGRNGSILMEIGHGVDNDFRIQLLEVEYRERRDAPFLWAYMSKEWLLSTLDNLDYSLIEVLDSANGMHYSIVRATP